MFKNLTAINASIITNFDGPKDINTFFWNKINYNLTTALTIKIMKKGNMIDYIKYN